MITPDILEYFAQAILGSRQPVTYNEVNDLIFPNRQYRIIGWYGKGQNGLIFQVEALQDGAVYALKVFNAQAFPSEEAALREFHIQKKFAQYNMAPQVHLMGVHATEFRGRPVQMVRVLMDPIHCTFLQYVRDTTSQKKAMAALLCLMRKKYLLEYPYPFLHSDMHYNNVVVLKDRKTLGFIDFGLTVQKPALLQVLDAIPLVMSLKRAADFYPGELKRTIEECARDIVQLYNRFFTVDYVWEGFELHPSGTYQYRAPNGMILHSYDWPPDAAQGRTSLPTESDIQSVFPTIDPPKVTG